MDKRKLVNIIVKDLEEIKVLSEEVADSEDNSALIIDLALHRARLLCQEIELLRGLAGISPSLQDEADQFSFDKEEEEVSELQFPDPELEILNFEQAEEEYATNAEIPEDEESEAFEEEEYDDLESDVEDPLMEDEDHTETIKDDLEKIAENNLEEDDLEEEDLEEEDLKEEILEEDELEEDDWAEEEVVEEKITATEEKVVIEEKVAEKPTAEPKIQITELKNTLQPGMREIHIDDLDDEDEIVPLRFTPSGGTSTRPPMREIPKPEFLEPEMPENGKMVFGEKYHKERSLNDSMAEKKPVDTPFINNRITSLRAAIGLNDRFLFIREIFENNTEKYNQVIEHLDKLERIQEAVEYLKANLSMQKNEASMKFVDLLKRRFTP